MSKFVGATAKPPRQRLIGAGEGLFVEHGWNGVSIRTIAVAAGASLAALNHHFGEKEMLAEIFVERARPIAAERMRLLPDIETGSPQGDWPFFIASGRAIRDAGSCRRWTWAAYP
jgi:AcrR family transcriptional regulator